MEAPKTEIPQVENMTAAERLEARVNVSATRAQLLEWLHATQRQWMVINAIDLVNALPVEGLEAFQQIVSRYRLYRHTKPTGRVVEVENPKTKQKHVVAETYGEQLDAVEAEEALRYLLTLVRELDPGWTLARL